MRGAISSHNNIEGKLATSLLNSINVFQHMSYHFTREAVERVTIIVEISMQNQNDY